MIEKLEAYINRKKRKVDRKVLSILFFLFFGLSVVFGMDSLVRFKKQKNLTENEYNRSMYEMIGYVKNINVQLKKLEVASSNKIITITLADIWRQSNLAKENLANLPIIQDNMGNTSKFLAQLSDFSYFLIEKVSEGKEISKEEYDKISQMSEYASKLFGVTSKIYDDLNEGRIKWDEVKDIANESFSKTEDINVYSISKTFQDYAGLIYDGAFSEHILNIEPKMLKKKNISKEEVENILKNIFGEKEIEFVNEESNKIDLYHFKIIEELNEKNIYVTKDSGLIYLIISDRKVEKKEITEKEAIDIGKRYLEKLGIESMIDTYFYTEENMMTINYAYLDNDVLIYPDLVKVKVALDNGEVCSLECQGYIFNHTDRDLKYMNFTEDEIKQKLNSNLKVIEIKKAVIPTDAKEEIKTYEIKCEYKDRTFLIYLNADSFEEEKILTITDTVKGTVTM